MIIIIIISTAVTTLPFIPKVRSPKECADGWLLVNVWRCGPRCVEQALPNNWAGLLEHAQGWYMKKNIYECQYKCLSCSII